MLITPKPFSPVAQEAQRKAIYADAAVAAEGRAGMAMLVTRVATALAVLTWITIEWFAKTRITILGFASGAVAGFVAITPASGFVNVNGALMIGLAAGMPKKLLNYVASKGKLI